nr:unnamed protein product [Digitaria exilis]
MATTTTRRRPPNSDLFRTLTNCTRRGDAAAAMAAFDAAVSDPDAPPRLAAHQYNQLLHLVATADRSSVPSPAAAARRVFSHMLQAGAPPSEATITSLARVTAADDPDEAFHLVATMKDKHGLAPRLRSYSPVLAAFRRTGDAAKAYAVEAHMAASGVPPEEPELAALLDVSSAAGDADKVYEYMHKLRQTVGCVTEETAQLVEGWFRTDQAAMTGKPQWDAAQVKDAIVLNGGGCHQLGWLGAGPWTVQRVRAEADGQCGGCKCRLACVDIDMQETQRFADSVAGLALERETKANFSQFQEWLEANKGYEAIVDAANIALYQQNFAEGGFSLTQVKYTFNKGKAVLLMPPPYSSEIQESEMGSWHMPMEEKSGDERIRIWLCISRTGSCKEPDEVTATNGVVQEAPPTEAYNGVQQGLTENKAESITGGKRKDRD